MDERSGKHVYYQLIAPSTEDSNVMESLFEVLESAANEINECKLDDKALRLQIEKRSNRARIY